MSPIPAPPPILINKKPIHSNCFCFQRKTPIPFFPCQSSYIHPSQLFQQCLIDGSACRGLSPPDWFLCCVHPSEGNSSLTVYKPEDLCFALELFFLRFDHLLIVLFCLSSKFCLFSSNNFFPFSLKSGSIPLNSSNKMLIKKCVQTISQSLSAVTLSN